MLTSQGRIQRRILSDNPLMRSRLFLCLLVLASAASVAPAQIPASTSTVDSHYSSTGTAGQPFTITVLDARRTVGNVLQVRMTLTNRGTEPLRVNEEFADSTQPSENAKISAVYVIDPNGRRKFPVLKDSAGRTLCSRIDPPLQPGERRQVNAEFAAPPDTTSAFDLYFPRTEPILMVPIGLPTAGEPIPAGADIGNPGGLKTPANPIVPGPSSAINQPTNNNEPDVYTNQTNIVAAGSTHKAVGSIESANSVVPFTVEVISLKVVGNQTILNLALTNGGSGELEVSGQFNGSLTDLANMKQISGVYLIDPVSKQRFEVSRPSQTLALCSTIERPLSAGERRTLEARFAALPASVKMVFIYFPHATPISDVPVSR